MLPDGSSDNEILQWGLREFQDFLFERYLFKKLVIVYGNCHTTVISDYLENCKAFNEQYVLYRMKPIHMIEDVSYLDSPFFQVCDVIMHQSIRFGNRYGDSYASDNIIKRLQKSCVVIAIPNVYRMPVCFFPQYSKDTEWGDKTGTWFFRDSLLDQYAIKGVSARRACQLYLSDHSFSSSYLDQELENFFEKVKKRETDWDVKCLAYIKNHYQSEQLFYDPNHPTNTFLLYITEEVLKLLGVAYDENALHSLAVGTLTGFEMPLLPEVKAHFGMHFPDSDNMRMHGRKLKQRHMDTREYVSQYLAFEWQNEQVPFWYRCISFVRFYLIKISGKAEMFLNKFNKQ